MSSTVAILGAGSWGTAIAVHLAHCGNQVRLWAHNKAHVALMRQENANARYLPGLSFPPGITVFDDVNETLKGAGYVFIATPSNAFGETLARIQSPIEGLAWLTKGLDPITHCVLSDLVSKRFGADFPQAMVSGPSFAKEVATFLPTALTLAGNNPDYSKAIQKLLHHKNMRVYLSYDMVGVQLCAAVKNVLAIAAGISDGLGFGANARAALVTRGLAEMSRLGRQLGAREETFSGLAGIGDLMLTCTDNQSRNRRFGLKLAEGLSSEEAEAEIGQVVEGKHNAAQIHILSVRHGVELPICGQVEALLKGQTTPKQAVLDLMNRSAKEEFKTL